MLLLFFIYVKRFYCLPKTVVFSYIFNIEVIKMTCFGFYQKIWTIISLLFVIEPIFVISFLIELIFSFRSFIIALRRVFVMKGWLLFRTTFCLNVQIGLESFLMQGGTIQNFGLKIKTHFSSSSYFSLSKFF